MNAIQNNLLSHSARSSTAALWAVILVMLCGFLPAAWAAHGGVAGGGGGGHWGGAPGHGGHGWGGGGWAGHGGWGHGGYAYHRPWGGYHSGWGWGWGLSLGLDPFWYAPGVAYTPAYPYSYPAAPTPIVPPSTATYTAADPPPPRESVAAQSLTPPVARTENGSTLGSANALFGR